MKRTLDMAAVAIVATAFAIEGHRIVTLVASPAPVVYTDVRAVNSPIVPGGELLVSYSFHRSRLCHCTLDRSVTAAANRLILWREIVACRLTQPGDISVLNPIRLPSFIREGDYLFDTTAYSACGDGVFVAIHPSVRFTIASAPP